MINYNDTCTTIKNFRPLREMVYEELREQIMTGGILPGARLMEVELAREMEVSRTPIREAIRKLEKEGLVDIEPRRGAYAASLSSDDMIDTLEVCQNAEGLAAFFAASRMTREQKKALKNASRQYDEAAAKADVAAMIHYDDEFHRIIAKSCNNKFLLQMLDQLHRPVLRFRYIHYGQTGAPDALEGTSDTHMAILEAIEDGDPSAARDAASAYIGKLKEQVME